MAAETIEDEKHIMGVGFDEFRQGFPYRIDLHAAEDEGRTEEATERRKTKAREEEGRVFLTQELPQGLVILWVFGLLWILGGYFYKEFKGLCMDYFLNRDGVLLSMDNVNGVLIGNVSFFLKMVLPVGVVALVSVVLGTMLQTKFHVSTANLKIDFSRIALSWNNFVKRTIFSRTQVLNLLKSYMKVFMIGLIGYLFFIYRLEDLVLLMGLEVSHAFLEMSKWTFQFITVGSLVFIFMAVPDWYVQRMEYLEQMKMSKHEVKEEIKELEVSPEIKQRQKERAKELSSRQMLDAVKTADVVITNPIHYACAIRYEVGLMDAPKLVAKGVDKLAKRIRDLAKEAGVVIVENKPLARSLYEGVAVNQLIPSEFYKAVAEILRVLDQYQIGREERT